jgi:HSP20 family protein
MDVKEKTTQAAVSKRSGSDFTEQLIEPFSQLRSEVDRLFQSFPFRLPALRLGRTLVFPAMETTESDKQYKVTAELPGLESEDIEVTFDDGFLRIAGEKSEKRDEKERGYRLSERSYGSFERIVELPGAAKDAEVDAKFKNGVLTLTVPKIAEPVAKKKKKKIVIRS